MSKPNAQKPFPLKPRLLVSFSAAILLFPALPLLAQDAGFSIFEPAKESASAPVVSPQEAFTRPGVKLPGSQFGTFGESASRSEPKLEGSKAVGTYAHDGRSMFVQPPATDAGEKGKLRAVTTNTLRAENRPQPDEATQSPPPIVVGEVAKPARRLTPKNPAVGAANDKPKIKQVAFQDGGFNPPANAAQENSADRFGQSGGSRLGNSAPSRFGNSAPSRFGSSTPNRFGQAPAKSNRFGSKPQASKTQPPSSPSARNQSSPSVRRSSAAARATARPSTTSQPLGPRAGHRKPSSALVSGGKAARELLHQWAEKKAEQKLPGKKLKFHEFLAQPIRGPRKDAINQYWVTFSDMAKHHLAVEQSDWLADFTAPSQAADQAVLKAAQQAAQNRVLQTEIQLAKSQAILGDYLPNLRYKNGSSIPVVPADIPWVGKLNTKFSEYQRRGIVPARFNSIDDVLPKARKLIANQAEAVKASSAAAEQAKEAMVRGQAPIANVLEAIRIQERNQREFLATVGGYNRAITDYVLSVRQDIYQPKRLASVLIGRKSVEPTLAKTKAQSQSQSRRQARKQAEVQSRRQTQAPEPDDGAPADVADGLSAFKTAESKNVAAEASMASVPLTASAASKASGASQKFAWGPTAASAKAANFDPAKLKDEKPMRQAQTKSGSSAYEGNRSNGNSFASQTSGGRVANRGASPAVSSPVRASNASARRSVGFGNQEASGNRNAFSTASQNRFSVGEQGFGTGAGKSATPVIPAAEAKKKPSPFATMGSSSSAGAGGTFGGASVNKPDTSASRQGISVPGSSRFGSSSFGSSTRR